MQTNIPSNIVSGHKAQWTKRFADYDPSLWTLSYHLRGTQALDVTAEDNGDGSFLVTLTAVTGDPSAPLTPGVFFVQAYVTEIADATNKRLVDQCRVNIIPDLSSEAVETHDGRTQAEITLTAIDAVLAGKATRDQASYTIGQRTLIRIPIPELLELQKHYAGVVQAEHIKARIKKGLSPFDNIHVQFRRPR